MDGGSEGNPGEQTPGPCPLLPQAVQGRWGLTLVPGDPPGFGSAEPVLGHPLTSTDCSAQQNEALTWWGGIQSLQAAP